MPDKSKQISKVGKVRVRPKTSPLA